MDSKSTHKLIFLPENRATFEAIQSGKKTIETRAGSPAYNLIQSGDTIEFSCGTDTFEKRVRGVRHYDTLEALFTAYTPAEMNPAWTTYEDARAAYAVFPGYESRVKQYGVLVFELQ